MNRYELETLFAYKPAYHTLEMSISDILWYHTSLDLIINRRVYGILVEFDGVVAMPTCMYWFVSVSDKNCVSFFNSLNYVKYLIFNKWMASIKFTKTKILIKQSINFLHL